MFGFRRDVTGFSKKLLFIFNGTKPKASFKAGIRIINRGVLEPGNGFLAWTDNLV